MTQTTHFHLTTLFETLRTEKSCQIATAHSSPCRVHCCTWALDTRCRRSQRTGSSLSTWSPWRKRTKKGKATDRYRYDIYNIERERSYRTTLSRGSINLYLPSFFNLSSFLTISGSSEWSPWPHLHMRRTLELTRAACMKLMFACACILLANNFMHTVY